MKRRAKRGLRARYGHAGRGKAFTVEAGRQILYEGKPFIGIDRKEGASPTEADAATRVIAECLNTKLGRGGVAKMQAQWMAHHGGSDTFRYKRGQS